MNEGLCGEPIQLDLVVSARIVAWRAGKDVISNEIQSFQCKQEKSTTLIVENNCRSLDIGRNRAKWEYETCLRQLPKLDKGA